MFRKKKPYVPTGRTGWIKEVFEGQGMINKGHEYAVDIHVEEVAVIGNDSRIKVLEIVGANESNRKMIMPLVQGILYPQSKILWDKKAPEVGSQIPEGLYVGPDGWKIHDAQGVVWVSVRQPSGIDPDEWHLTILARVCEALGVER